MPSVIGVDFDNTLVTYDNLIHAVASERNLIQPGTEKSKRPIRDAIRQLSGGEIEWQKVQAEVYGPRIAEATPAPGAKTFLQSCVLHHAKVYVISHKTVFANYDETGTNLRHAALSWIQQNCFFDTPISGLSEEDVYFASTRKEKLEHISRLKCTHFIDDLEETFLEASFPSDVERILYSPHATCPARASVKLTGNWPQIMDYLFDAKD
jgi:hypothetical protein